LRTFNSSLVFGLPATSGFTQLCLGTLIGAAAGAATGAAAGAAIGAIAAGAAVGVAGAGVGAFLSCATAGTLQHRHEK
jgi:hypothetical protein